MRPWPILWIVASIALLLASACVLPPSTPRYPPIPKPAPPPPTRRPAPPGPSPAYSGDMKDVYHNIKVLHGPASRLDATMREFNAALGVQCDHCHLQNHWEQDIPTKEKARLMVTLSNQENEKLPKGEVSCWTCHRGQAVPEALAALRAESPETLNAVRLIGLTEEQKQQPVEKVFKNLKEFGGFPAGNLPFAMAYYTKALGVDCKSCHVQPFAKDTPHKDIARAMIELVETTGQTFYKDTKNPIRCWTCHRGQAEIQSAPAPHS
jgi:hypothetical protein